MKYLPKIKIVLVVISAIIYFLMAGLAGALGSVGHTNDFFAVILPFAIFPAMVMRNISLFGLKWFHILITPLIFIGTQFTTGFLYEYLGTKTITETVDGIVQSGNISVYYSSHYSFQGYEFLIVLAVFFLLINIFRFVRYVKVP